MHGMRCTAKPSSCTEVWLQLENTRHNGKLQKACAANGGNPGQLKVRAKRLHLFPIDRESPSSTSATVAPAAFVQLLLDCCELPPLAPSPHGRCEACGDLGETPQQASVYCVVTAASSAGSDKKTSSVLQEMHKICFREAFEFLVSESPPPPCGLI